MSTYLLIGGRNFLKLNCSNLRKVNGFSGVASWLYVFEDAVEIMCGNMNFKHYVLTSFGQLIS
jgi:hypothetical protein